MPADNRPTPSIEKYMKDAEKALRKNDKHIKACFGALVAMVVWMVVADTFISIPAVTFHANWSVSSIQPLQLRTRADKRLFKRVTAQMRHQCDTADIDVAFGPQMRTGDAHYAFAVAHMCPWNTLLVNPRIIATGEDEGMCEDAHQGETKVKYRQYPIHVVSSDAGQNISAITLADACIVHHAVDMLNSKW